LPVFINEERENGTDGPAADASLPLPERLKIIEKTIINRTLKKHNYNQSKAAEELGISESGLRYKIQSLDILK
ncbi:MAG: hypothetical protein KAT34_05520, partial [Candidatus Aminicenantes bacterium]|nr:hypothetical protein [Candidatus Aminicenantes bacterium]